MTISSKKELLKIIKQRKFLNKDFDGFKQDLLEYAQTHFPNNIKDFSESSLGGLFLELAAYVGDVESFYLDHQFHEMNLDTAVEDQNIEAHLINSGVPIVGAAPAVVEVSFLIEVSAESTTFDVKVPKESMFPIIHAGTTLSADNGTQFRLTEDVDFRETDASGELRADIQVANRDANNRPTTFILSLNGEAISGFENTESFSVGGFAAFKKFTLSKENITEVISVDDNQGNEYFGVEYLTQDTVFERVENLDADNILVKDTIVVKPAPFRFKTDVSLNTRLTTLTFGGGSAESLDDDIIPDVSEFAVPLFGKRNFSRFTLNPQNLLRTTTLGVIAPNSTITVLYRYGGGLTHNVGPRSIRGIAKTLISFPNNPSVTDAQFVRSSMDAVNFDSASGGEDAPTIDELKERVPGFKASQSRVVTKEDLLARIYTMPSNFGRVFRAAVHQSAINPLASELYIISRDSDSVLTVSPDRLKENIATYINEFRLTNDAIDILDARVVNVGIDFSISSEPGANRQLIKQLIVQKLKQYFDIKNFEIDQPVMINDIENIIFNSVGVLSVNRVDVINIFGDVLETSSSEARIYSSEQWDTKAATKNKIIFPPKGGMFEVRFKDFDIRGVIV